MYLQTAHLLWRWNSVAQMSGSAGGADLCDIYYRVAAFAAVEAGLHFVTEFNGAIDKSEESVVGTHSDVLAGNDASATLADNDHARFGPLAIADLDAQKLWIGVR